jgi:hypothetical protein
LGAFVGGDVVGTVDRRSQGRFLARRELGQLQQAEQYDLNRQGEQAKIDLTRANTEYARRRPDIEAQKRAEQAAKSERAAVLSNLRLLRGTRLDPANPRHAALLERAANSGIEIDPDSFNAAGSNLVPVDVVDPNNPTQKRRQYYNKATGELTDVGQTGYVQPVIGAGPDAGMTPTSARAARDRVAGQAETGRHNRATENQGAQRIGITRENQGGRGGLVSSLKKLRLSIVS